ncbi:MAG: hypothetical protein V3T49_02520, partial [Dehalococcoidia bacterium]
MATISTTEQPAEITLKPSEDSGTNPDIRLGRRLLVSNATPLVVIALLVVAVGSGFLFSAGPETAALINVGPSDASYTALAYARSLAVDQHIGFSPISNSSTSTGMSWILFLVPIQGIAEVLPISSMLLAKIAGLVLLFVAGVAVFNIAKITSKAKWLALVAVAPLVLEPRFVYAAVAGTEHAFLAATLGWLLVFRIRRQLQRTSLAAAVAVGIWPIGALVYIGYAIDVILQIRWSAASEHRGAFISPLQLTLLRIRLLPATIVFVVVAAITFFTDGGLLPSTFGRQSNPFEFGDWQNMRAIITDYMPEYSAFDTPLFIASLAIILIGFTAIWRRARTTSVVLLPLCLVYLYFLSGWRNLDSPAFFQWNLVA